MIFIMTLAFFAGLAYHTVNLIVHSSEWITHPMNENIPSSYGLEYAGKILDRNGVVLAQSIDKKRVYSSLLAIPTGKIASDVGAAIAFGVPKSACRPGETLVFGYDQYKAELVVPGKK